MLQSAKIGRQIAATCIGVAYGTSVVFLVLKLYLIQEKQAKTGKRSLVFESYFPYDVTTTPSFEITWMTQSLFAFFTTTSYSGTDSFFAVLVLHLCGQLEVLSADVKNLVRLDGKNSNFDRNFKNIIIRHAYLNRFANRIEEIFNRLFLFQIIACLGLFCLQGYQIILIIIDKSVDLPILRLLFLVMFVVYMMLDLYIYCLVAERLEKRSTGIAYAAYDCHWYHLSSRQALQLWFIVKRAQKPLEITVGKFSALSFGLFTNIVKTSMGYLSMLLAVREKIK